MIIHDTGTSEVARLQVITLVLKIPLRVKAGSETEACKSDKQLQKTKLVATSVVGVIVSVCEYMYCSAFCVKLNILFVVSCRLHSLRRSGGGGSGEANSLSPPAQYIQCTWKHSS